jgi:alkanesulfonate monooxygenase SsuD/methylene tetrahydromethanopterin reductase-like flavin-dependent oxidoreductase (luciferase family)
MIVGMPWLGSAIAAEAEQAGVMSFCTGDFVDHDAYTTLTEMVATTRDALVGTAIAYAFARSPYAHATAIRQLTRTAGDRLFLGLGTGSYRINRDWLGAPADRPAARLADTVGAIRAWLHAENGCRVQYTGEFHRIDADVRAPVLGRLDVPIMMAAFNKRMAESAGRVADGVIGHGLFTRRWWGEVVRPAVNAGRAENTSPGHAEHGWVIAAIDDHAPEQAIADTRRMIAFYLTVKTYDPYVRFHGWESPVAAVHEAFAAGETDAMAKAVTDEMLAEIAVCGTTSDALATIARRRESLPRDVTYLAPPSFLVGHRRRQAYARANLALVGTLVSPRISGS